MRLNPLCVLAALCAIATPAAPAAVPAADLRALSQAAEHELRGDILPFWMKYTRNPADGGYYGLISADMKAEPEAPRGALLTSRILWTFSAAYRVYRDPAYLEMARWAYRDLTEHFTDPDYGGLFWTIRADGSPLDDHKQIYGQVFGLYALAEYYRATGESAALDAAVRIYRLVEAHARDRTFGGYLDAFDRRWSQLQGRNPIGDAPKSQNTHIHILEAYTQLLRVWPDEGLKADQRALVEVTLDHILDSKTHHLILFMNADWTPASDRVSYGHDIELSWLLVEAARVLGDPALVARVRPIAVDIARVTLEQGVDPDGGVLNESDPKGLVDSNKDWWPQAEAMVGFLNAYQISGDPKYLEASRHSWQFIQARLLDRVHGDWIESVSRDGTPRVTAKVSLWKCPYHSGRSCFEVVARVGELLGEPGG